MLPCELFIAGNPVARLDLHFINLHGPVVDTGERLLDFAVSHARSNKLDSSHVAEWHKAHVYDSKFLSQAPTRTLSERLTGLQVLADAVVPQIRV